MKYSLNHDRRQYEGGLFAIKESVTSQLKQVCICFGGKSFLQGSKQECNFGMTHFKFGSCIKCIGVIQVKRAMCTRKAHRRVSPIIKMVSKKCNKTQSYLKSIQSGLTFFNKRILYTTSNYDD